MILQVLARSSTNILIKKDIILEKDKEIYCYGFEVFYSTFFAVLSIMLLACILNSWILGFIFLLYFIPIRVFAGGFHAKTYERCFVLTNAVFLLSLLFQYILRIFNWRWSLIIVIICIIIIILKAPVENVNAPLTIEKAKKNARMVKICLLLEFVGMGFIYMLGLNNLALMAVSATAAVALMIII